MVNYYSRTQIKPHKGDEKWPLFWCSTSITLDNNNEVLTDFRPFFSLHTFITYLGWRPDWLYFCCLFCVLKILPFGSLHEIPLECLWTTFLAI